MRRKALLCPFLAAAMLIGCCLAAPLSAAPAHPPAKPTAEKAKLSEKRKGKNPAKKPEPDGPPAPADVAPPYEPQLLRLSEMLGALAYLQDLCGHHHNGEVWRAKMTALLDAEAKTATRKERLAGAFNRGFRGYALTYRECTPNARAIISRFLGESGKLAQELARRYGPS